MPSRPSSAASRRVADTAFTNTSVRPGCFTCGTWAGDTFGVKGVKGRRLAVPVHRLRRLLPQLGAVHHPTHAALLTILLHYQPQRRAVDSSHTSNSHLSRHSPDKAW
jgi:hypothetical protein